jgi:hypothetical protein
LNVIIRTPGGASLHSWSLGFSVRCGDNNHTPITRDVPARSYCQSLSQCRGRRDCGISEAILLG